MMRFVYYFVHLLVVSAFVYIHGASTDKYVNLPPSDNATPLLNEENMPLDLMNKASVQGEVCNDINLCQNEGICIGGQCRCPKDYSGPRCETPTWCTWGRCGYGSDVECVWNRLQRKGECRCTKRNYHYLPKDRKCHECDCGGHGSCQVVDDMLVCKCDEDYALKASKCESCDCGLQSERCSFDSSGKKICQCPKDYASKTATLSWYGTWCEICSCGEHGRCSWKDEEKFCDCEDGYRSFKGKCIECDCGQHGACILGESGEKMCFCDSGYAEEDGFCEDCNCNLYSTDRNFWANCTFVDGLKYCVCPPGFERLSEHCEDINECYTTHPCPANSLCINKPGTFECKCKSGYKPIRSSIVSKLSGCEDIDECAQFPCTSPATRCVNNPGSFDCVCREGFYATSGTYGSSYKPAYNACYEVETQWREATIALGVILSVGIIWISCYIMKHKSSS